MKTSLNLNLEFTESGTPFIRVYQPVFLDANGTQVLGMRYSSEEAAINHAHIHCDVCGGYRLLYVSSFIVFLK